MSQGQGCQGKHNTNLPAHAPLAQVAGFHEGPPSVGARGVMARPVHLGHCLWTIVCPSLGFPGPQCQARAPHSGPSPAPGRMRDSSCLKTQPAGTDGAGAVLVCCPMVGPGELQPHLFALQGVLESFLGTAFAGSIFCLFSGQPLTILSSTGPVLVFERLLFSFSE